MKRIYSIWDYPKPGLDPDVWDEAGKLREEHKKAILSHLYGALLGFGFENFDEWIEDIIIVGSLTSYQYNRFSDLDVHVIVNPKVLMETEGLNEVSEERLIEYLNEDLRKFLNVKAQIKLEGTEHPVEYYFEAKEIKPATKDEGVYSIFTDTWLKPPRTFDLDFNPDIYYAERKKVIEEFIKEFDLKVMDIQRLVRDVDFLKETFEVMPEVVKKKWKKWINGKIEAIEKEIEELSEKVEEVIKARREEYGRETEANLLFKYLQRYQYIWLAKQLEKALELENEKMVEKVKDILVEFPYKTERSSIKKFEQVPVGKKEEEKRMMPQGLPSEPAKTEKPIEMPERKEEPVKPKSKLEEDEEIAELRKMLEEEEEEIPKEERVFEKEPLIRKPEQELAELVEAPRVFKRLGPIDRQIFYALERQRRDAISKGDLDALKRIHDEEEKLIEKYTKEVIKRDELSGFSFGVRQVQTHYFPQRRLGDYVNKAFEKIADELTKMGIIIYSASLLASETNEWEENPKTGYTEWNLLIGSVFDDWCKNNIIVLAEVDKDKGVKIYPYFFDYLGRKYSFDEVSLKKFLQTLRKKPSDEWIKSLGWEEDKDIISIDNKYVWSSIEKMEVEEAINKHLKEVDYALLTEIKFDERNGKVRLIYTILKTPNPLKTLRVPRKIKFASFDLMKERVYSENNKVIVEYKKEEKCGI